MNRHRRLPLEFRLAAACAIWPPGPERSEAVARALDASSPDWQRFLGIVRRHRVEALAFHALADVPTVPEDVRTRLRAAARTTATQALAHTAEAGRLCGLMAERGIPTAVLKGPPLARDAYGNIGLRHLRDIDLLVAPEDLTQASALLAGLGYVAQDQASPLMMRHGCHLEFRHAGMGLCVELHWRLVDNPFQMPPAPPSAHWRRQDGGLPVALTGDAMLLYLFVHGARHCWNRLKWLADVAALTRSRPMVELERLLAVAHGTGTLIPVAQGMVLASLLLAAPLPAQVERLWRRSPRLRLLVAAALRAMTAGDGVTETGAQALGTTLVTASHYLLGQGWRYWLDEIRTDAICIKDWRELPLPEALLWLYPVLRLPLWLRRVARRAFGGQK